jgi:hypothetical protein
MSEPNSVPPVAPKKTHIVRNVILVVIIIFCLWSFFALASFFISPGGLGMIIDKIAGGKFDEIASNLGSSGNNLMSGANAPASENYLVKQKSSMPLTISAPKGVIDAKADINFITVGYPMSKAQSGKYGWQTDWKVIVNSVSNLGTKTQIKDPASGLHTSAMTTDFSPSSTQNIYYFSLANVKEGGTFQVRYIQKNIKDATFHFNESQWIFYDDKNQPFQMVNFDTNEKSAATVASPADAKTLDAILVKDNGAEGAIVGFKPVDLTKEQKAQLEAMNQTMQGKGELTGWWNSQLYPMYTNLPQQPPLKIVLKSGLPESGYFEEKITNADYMNAAPDVDVKTNPNDKNGDGLPDLVPLPGAQK